MCIIDSVYTLFNTLKIIKINATTSTNTFLKELAQNHDLKHFTVITSNTQTKGKGQLGKKWFSSPHKNLTFSVFTKFENFFTKDKRYLNFAISLAVYECLIDLKTPGLHIKWPNDILSVNKKISGILIEPNLQGEFIKSAVIGVGLNVNEENFPKELKQATSLKRIHKTDFNLDEVFDLILDKIERYINLLNTNELDLLEKKYLDKLYKKGVVSTFLGKEKRYFSGIIKGVSKNGDLLVYLENETLQNFRIEDIKLIY